MPAHRQPAHGEAAHVRLRPAAVEPARAARASLAEHGPRGALQRRVQALADGSTRAGPARMGTVQLQPVLQRREVAEIEAALDLELQTLAALQFVGQQATVDTINGRDAALTLRAQALDALTQEVRATVGAGVPDLEALERRVGEINLRQPTLDQAIATAEGPAPPKPATAWGGGGQAGPYLAWKAHHDQLADNRQERDRIVAERDVLAGQRPAAVLQDKLARLTARHAVLREDLRTAQEQRYFYLLMTTVAPVRGRYEHEGNWDSGASVLGIFHFTAPGPLQGIPPRVHSVEVHIHFRQGSKAINRAHIKSGWSYTILAPDGPWYAEAALTACKQTIDAKDIL